VLRRIRALAPAPGLALDIEGLELVVTEAALAHDYPSALQPGEAAALPTGCGAVIRTGDGAVMLLRAFCEDPSAHGAPAPDEEPAALGPAAIAAALQARLRRER
jgi:methionyl-tRNA formyltransferase